MEQHYSAFISYKHAPADTAIAAEIQKRLERYHIPAAIRKKTGREKIGRIFRDKEELPITSDLGDDISRALEDADFLIVICSSSTKLSTWVPREIDYFLKYHSQKQILTVLVDGEPEEVIPERLLSDIVTRTAAVLNEGDCHARCFSIGEDAVLWENDLAWEYPWELPAECAYSSAEVFGREAAAVCIANTAYVLDMETGEILASQIFTETVIGVMEFDQSELWVFLSNGDMGCLTVGEDEELSSQYPSFIDTGTPVRLKKLIFASSRETNKGLLLCMQRQCSYIIGYEKTYDQDGTVFDSKTYTSMQNVWLDQQCADPDLYAGWGGGLEDPDPGQRICSSGVSRGLSLCGLRKCKTVPLPYRRWKRRGCCRHLALYQFYGNLRL